MNKLEISGQNKELKEILSAKGLSILFSYCQNRNDIKINGKKQSVNYFLKQGDVAELYFDYQSFSSKYFHMVYEDENIIIANKNAGIEVCDSDFNLEAILKINTPSAKAVHRIDRNTRGLVIFAKNDETEKLLLNAFKNRLCIQKEYTAIVDGLFPLKENTIMRAFLKKDAAKGKVTSSKVEKAGYLLAETKVTSVKHIKGKKHSSLSLELITGRTHQIRATLALYGYPIIGDGKYGRGKRNEEMLLAATRISFDFPPDNKLSYLNNHSFEIDLL